MNFHEPEVVEMGLAEKLIQEIEFPVDVENLGGPAKTYPGIAIYSSPEVVEMGTAKELIHEIEFPVDVENLGGPAKTYPGITIYSSLEA